ncbi:retrovirus-related pol polyprotein from transposon TNT 1-94 [Tanacetum coccineum]
MFDEYFNPPSVVSIIIFAATLLPPDTAGASSFTSIDQDAPCPSTSTNNETTPFKINSTNVEEPNNEEESEFDSDTFTNPFAPPKTSSKQVPRAWYDLLSKLLLSQQFIKGAVDPTLFTRKEGEHIILLQIYVDDIIFAFTNPSFCDKFADQMDKHFKMSMMGQMSFFLGLQISQNPRGIFKNQSKYALEMLKKYVLDQCDPVDIPMVESHRARDLESTRCFGVASIKEKREELVLLAMKLVLLLMIISAAYAKPTEKHLTTVKQMLTMQVAKTQGKLADIFTKALARERFKFLVKRLGMQSITSEELKHLAEFDEDED